MMGPEREETPVIKAMSKATKTAARAALGKGTEGITHQIMRLLDDGGRRRTCGKKPKGQIIIAL
jgi:hypothetical protein